MQLLKSRELVLGLIILGLVIGISIRAPVFVTPESMLNQRRVYIVVYFFKFCRL